MHSLGRGLCVLDARLQRRLQQVVGAVAVAGLDVRHLVGRTAGGGGTSGRSTTPTSEPPGSAGSAGAPARLALPPSRHGCVALLPLPPRRCRQAGAAAPAAAAAAAAAPAAAAAAAAAPAAAAAAPHHEIGEALHVAGGLQHDLRGHRRALHLGAGRRQVGEARSREPRHRQTHPLLLNRHPHRCSAAAAATGAAALLACRARPYLEHVLFEDEVVAPGLGDVLLHGAPRRPVVVEAGDSACKHAEGFGTVVRAAAGAPSATHQHLLQINMKVMAAAGGAATAPPAPACAAPAYRRS